MKSAYLTITFILISIVLLPSTVIAEQDAEDKQTIRWPLPPSKTRFVYVKSIYGEPESKNEGFFSSLASFLFGDEAPNYFTRPHDIAVSSTGLMVVTDPGAGGIHIINSNNDDYQFIQQLDGTRLISPIGVTFMGQGEILLTDSQARTIYRLSTDGEKLGQIVDKALQRPTDIAVNPVTKHIYVVDTLGHSIHVYNQTGKKIRQLGKRGGQAGEFNYPTHLTFNSQGELYVTDSMNFRVQIFDKQHRPKVRFGKLGDRLGEFSKPKGIALDQQDNIYIVDSHFDHLLVYDKNGRFLLPIGGHGAAPGLFNIPIGITVSRHFIYIVDAYNRRVQILKSVGQVKQQVISE